MSFNSLPEAVEQPHYDRTQMKSRILHIGFGAFARAHWMVYHQQLLQQDPAFADWGVCVARLNSGVEALEALDEKDHLYSVLEQSDQETRTHLIGCIKDTAHPGRDGLDSFLGRFASPDLAIVTLTITEKGYCSRAGHLDHDHSGIKADLASPSTPRTAIGILVEGLRLRKMAGLQGLTILSLDNLPSNGRICQQVVLDYAAQIDRDLTEWIKVHVSFPCSMVDRIVPALNEEGKHLIREALGGQDDPNGIVCEPFRQWVIEDKFSAGRPAWEKVGAQFVEDVEPFEEMKLRLLNGSHSFLAYLGSLAGYRTVADCMGDENFRKTAHALMMSEQAPTLSVPENINLKAYADDLIQRYSNSKLKHQTAQIASDGSQKLPQRMLSSLAWHLKNASDWSLLALGIAGWMRYVRELIEQGNEAALNDPLAETLIEVAKSKPDGEPYISALLSLESIFPATLSSHDVFRKKIETSYAQLKQFGAKQAVANLVSTSA